MKIAISLLAIALICGCASEPTLRKQLDAKAAGFKQKAPAEKIKLYEGGIEQVRATGIERTAKNVGDGAPDFALSDASGKTVKLSDLLKKGSVVLTWYRGGWCPYCNIALAAMQKKLPEIKAQGAELVAISPELPGKAAATAKKVQLDFTVLSDVGNKVARQYGVAFKLPDPIAKAYSGFFDIEAYNGDRSNVLPMAATYVIDTKGVIRWAFVDADYKKRAEPADVVAALRRLK
jgi:peroxiredoxin